VACGGHAWSRDGVAFSNLTVGAFGPRITLADGTVWANDYVERPLVTMGPAGAPLALYLGMARGGGGYDGHTCNWAAAVLHGRRG